MFYFWNSAFNDIADPPVVKEVKVEQDIKTESRRRGQLVEIETSTKNLIAFLLSLDLPEKTLTRLIRSSEKKLRKNIVQHIVPTFFSIFRFFLFGFKQILFGTSRQERRTLVQQISDASKFSGDFNAWST